MTDSEGKYSISVPASGGTLVFSFIGLKTTEVMIGNQSTINVALEENLSVLSEVVVTALGESRDVKTLTYATQQIDSKTLNITNGIDMKNALSGKVAGVSVAGQAGPNLVSLVRSEYVEQYH